MFTNEILDSLIESTNSLLHAHGLPPVCVAPKMPNPIQKHTAFLDLGVMGDYVAATVEWKFDLDFAEKEVDILRIVIDMRHKFHGMDVYTDLPERVIDDIKIDIAKEWE